MTTWPILSVVTFLPLVGALLVYVVRGDDEATRRNSRWIALWTTLITFAISLILVARFDPGVTDFQFVEKTPWLAAGITYHMGVDGISLPFVILTTALLPLCIIASWKSVTVRVREYMMAFLVLETLMVGTFCALDLVLFYLFFEGGLIPMFLIIDGFGPDGVSARVLDVTRNVVKIQTGYLYHYAFAMLIGVAGLITWFMFGFGGQ